MTRAFTWMSKEKN